MSPWELYRLVSQWEKGNQTYVPIEQIQKSIVNYKVILTNANTV